MSFPSSSVSYRARQPLSFNRPGAEALGQGSCPITLFHAGGIDLTNEAKVGGEGNTFLIFLSSHGYSVEGSGGILPRSPALIYSSSGWSWD